MAVTMEGFRQYGYLAEGDLDEQMARMCISASKAYLLNAGCPEPAEDNPLYDMAVYMLAVHWYDHRGVMDAGAPKGPILYGVQAIIHQICNYGTGGG